MRYIITKFLFTILILLCFISCASTEIYSYSDDKFYEDGELISSIHSVTKDGKLLEKERDVYQKFKIDEDYLASVKFHEDMKKKNGDATVLIYKNGYFNAECDFTEKNGVFKPARELNTTKTDRAIKEAVKFLKNEDIEKQMKKTRGSLYRETTSGKITVESETDGAYMAYSFLGKPFVILGSTTWSLLKCVGYSFVNFMGGVNLGMGGNNYWMMPSVKDAVEKKKRAQEKNKIVYPEFHKPFTKNHMTVEIITTKTENLFTENEKSVVTSSDVRYYDNTIKVSNSAAADAAATASVVNVIGNAVTIPVSGVSWFCGLLCGAAANAYR